MKQAKETHDGTPATAAMPTAAAGIDLDPIVKKVFEEIQAAEEEVIAAREKLAAARGKLEILGQLQQLSAGNGQTQA